MKKYYFVSLWWERRVWADGYPCSTEKDLRQDVIDIHPIEYQLQFNESYSTPKKSGRISDQTECETVYVISWQALSEEEYEKFKDEI